MTSVAALPTPPLSTDTFVDLSAQPSSSNRPKVVVNDDEPVVRPHSSICFERCMGDSELSYYLPSRESGVNDMYLHIGFRAPKSLARQSRAILVWAILRLKHPLLTSSVVMHDYEDVRFVYTPPPSADHAMSDARNNFCYSSKKKDELVNSYLNGPRTLSNQRLSYLIFSVPGENGISLPSPPLTPDPDLQPDELHSLVECQWFVCAAHFLGDGMALHQFANDYFGLFGSNKSDAELKSILDEEWRTRWKDVSEKSPVLPLSLEDRLPPPIGGKFRRAVERVDFKLSQEKLIGGHGFPRNFGKPRHTVVPTVSFEPEDTVKMLKLCKSKGVSISSVMFAICNIAWARVTREHPEFPMMMYSALNMRPYLSTSKSLYESYWYLAVGYFNVVLPSFLPSVDVAKTFWHRARSAKEQSTRAAKNPMVISRSREMALERGERARGWAREDDAKANGTWQAPPPPPKAKSPKTPSVATIGLSLLGNLDGIYKHGSFPDLQLHTLTTGSRQRPGGMLLFSYTFAGKLWVSLGYDENGFDQTTVQNFWKNVLDGIQEFLVI